MTLESYSTHPISRKALFSPLVQYLNLYPIIILLFFDYNIREKENINQERKVKVMRRKILIVCLLMAIIVTGCNLGLSENEVQQAIDDALATSAAQNEQAPAPPSGDEGSDNSAELDAANQALTEQAAQIQTQDSQLATLNAGPTATETILETPTNTAQPTETAPLIPEGQKIVIAKKNAPLWKVDGYNDKDNPVMVKLDPVVRYEQGEWILVYDAAIKADGGALYYQVVGPIGAGYYVLVGDVRDQ
jgi:hypothetical protein